MKWILIIVFNSMFNSSPVHTLNVEFTSVESCEKAKTEIVAKTVVARPGSASWNPIISANCYVK